MTVPSKVDELLDQADALQRSGQGAAARPLYEEAIERSRADGDLASWTRAALGAANLYVYGTEPGKLPAQLYDVLARTVEAADRGSAQRRARTVLGVLGELVSCTRFRRRRAAPTQRGPTSRSCSPTASMPPLPVTGVPTSLKCE